MRSRRKTRRLSTCGFVRAHVVSTRKDSILSAHLRNHALRAAFCMPLTAANVDLAARHGADRGFVGLGGDAGAEAGVNA